MTQLDKSKAPGLDKICPSILKDDRIIDFVDFKKAFDSFPRGLLWQSSQKLVLEGSYWNQ